MSDPAYGRCWTIWRSQELQVSGLDTNLLTIDSRARTNRYSRLDYRPWTGMQSLDQNEVPGLESSSSPWILIPLCLNLYTQFSRKQAQNACFYPLKRAFWACFRENWVYKFGHWTELWFLILTFVTGLNSAPNDNFINLLCFRIILFWAKSAWSITANKKKNFYIVHYSIKSLVLDYIIRALLFGWSVNLLTEVKRYIHSVLLSILILQIFTHSAPRVIFSTVRTHAVKSLVVLELR